MGETVSAPASEHLRYACNHCGRVTERYVVLEGPNHEADEFDVEWMCPICGQTGGMLVEINNRRTT